MYTLTYGFVHTWLLSDPKLKKINRYVNDVFFVKKDVKETMSVPILSSSSIQAITVFIRFHQLCQNLTANVSIAAMVTFAVRMYKARSPPLLLHQHHFSNCTDTISFQPCKIHASRLMHSVPLNMVIARFHPLVDQC
jgi:hypothetical protein